MYSRGAMISESLAYEKMFAFIEIYTKKYLYYKYNNIQACLYIYIFDIDLKFS